MGGGIIGGKNLFGPTFVFLRLRRQHPFLHKTKGPTRNPISPIPPPLLQRASMPPPPPPPPPPRRAIFRSPYETTTGKALTYERETNCQIGTTNVTPMFSIRTACAALSIVDLVLCCFGDGVVLLTKTCFWFSFAWLTPFWLSLLWAALPWPWNPLPSYFTQV